MYEVTIFSESDQAVICVAKFIHLQVEFFVTFVYPQDVKEEKKFVGVPTARSSQDYYSLASFGGF